MVEVSKYKELLLLNLSKNEEHEEIIKSIESLFSLIIDYQENTSDNFDDIQDEITMLRTLGRDYFKKEWDKAKSRK
ncbi:MAG: hypothetical protein ACTHYV_06695 [Psychroflexus sp.]